MAELKIEKIQEKEKVEVLSQCGSGTSIYSANNCSYMVNNSSSRKRYASPKAGTELYLDLVFRQ